MPKEGEVTTTVPNGNTDADADDADADGEEAEEEEEAMVVGGLWSSSFSRHRGFFSLLGADLKLIFPVI